MTKQTKMLVLLGLPVLILILAGIAITGFLSYNLVVTGVQERAPGTFLLGLFLSGMWLMMFVKTARARSSDPSEPGDTESGHAEQS